tara:strand:- start:8829 stop:11165 length:2337 start_codon:yes stop_codon:yes gene_type:complete
MAIAAVPMMTPEKEMVELGKQQFHSNINKLRGSSQESKTPYGKKLANGIMPPLTKVIQQWFEGASTVAGYNRDVAQILEEIPTETLADLTSRVILDSISIQMPLGTLTLKLGSFMEEEARLRTIQRLHKKEWRLVEASINRRVGFRYRKYSSRALANRLGLVWDNWSPTIKCKVGSVLVDLFRKATGLIELISLTSEKTKQVYHVKPTSDALDWINNYKKHHEDLCPIYLPTDSEEGYRELPLALYKTRNPVHMEILDRTSMPRPLVALRKLQTTAWRINGTVLATAEYFWKNQMDIAGFPPSKADRMPVKPPDIDTNKEARDKWRRSAAYYHKSDLSFKGTRLLISKILWAANKFKESPNFHFPHQFDFRGRTYAVPNFLNFQGTDLSRGLLRFAQSRPIDMKGEVWFLKYGPALWGKTMSEDEARMWMVRHEHYIKATAADPMSELWWTNAEKPWQFLAWCLEAAQWIKGSLAESSLPITVDASSNGLQIMSLMMRYEKGAIDTNCTASGKPADIYLNVLEAVKEKLQGTTTGWDWIELGLDRSLIKTIIMTIPYGCTQYRAEELIVQWYYGKGSSLFEGRLRKSVGYLASSIVNVFYNLYPEYSRLMVFLESVPKKLESPMVWYSPSGFPVYQAYYKSTAKRVKSLLFGRIRSVVYREETGKLDTAKMSRAFTPNLIHCLDAAVLHMALERTKAPAVATVHDSFAAHASEIGGLVDDVKRSYLEIFGGDPSDFWRKIFTSDLVENQGLIDMAPDFSSLVGDFSVDGILTAGYMYR